MQAVAALGIMDAENEELNAIPEQSEVSESDQEEIHNESAETLSNGDGDEESEGDIDVFSDSDNGESFTSLAI